MRGIIIGGRTDHQRKDRLLVGPIIGRRTNHRWENNSLVGGQIVGGGLDRCEGALAAAEEQM